jgi:drug/metabolite transporter (DMT)-like permease
MNRALLFVSIAMVAFAANSLLCRMALVNTSIDPGLFTIIRLMSGALCLLILVTITAERPLPSNDTPSKKQSITSLVTCHGTLWGGISLFVYAVTFSYAYVSLSTGTGALLLFGAVQLTMIAYGLLHRERFSLLQWIGFLIAIGGLVALLLPSASAPNPIAALFMVIAGIAWGAYSLLGRKSHNPLLLTFGNFVYSSLLLIPLALWMWLSDSVRYDGAGVMYALMSGVLASGAGYAVWYRALSLIRATTAATVQLSVPVIATLMGWALLSEPLTLQVALASGLTLGGISLVIRFGKKA